MPNWIVWNRTVWSFKCVYLKMCLQITFNVHVKIEFDNKQPVMVDMP